MDRPPNPGKPSMTKREELIWSLLFWFGFVPAWVIFWTLALRHVWRNRD